MTSPEETAEPDHAALITDLLSKVDRWDHATCFRCSESLCGHQVLFSIALGHADRPWCLFCLARSLERQPDELRDSLLQHFRHRPCYDAVWNAMTVREGGASDRLPECLWPGAVGTSLLPGIDALTGPVVAASVSNTPAENGVEWDAGELACGDLLLQLRQRMRSLSPGAILDLTTRDRGAVEDIPAWCRLTGHRLLSQEHPTYRIERKAE